PGEKRDFCIPLAVLLREVERKAPLQERIVHLRPEWIDRAFYRLRPAWAPTTENDQLPTRRIARPARGIPDLTPLVDRRAPLFCRSLVDREVDDLSPLRNRKAVPVLHPGAGEHVIDPRGLRGPSPSSELGVEVNDEPRAEEPPVERRALGHVLLEEVAYQGDEFGVARGPVSDVVPGRRDRGPDQVVHRRCHLTKLPWCRWPSRASSSRAAVGTPRVRRWRTRGSSRGRWAVRRPPARGPP